MSTLVKILSATEMDAVGNGRLFTALRDDGRISTRQMSTLTLFVNAAPAYDFLQRSPKGATVVRFPDGSELRLTQKGHTTRVYPY
jgi:hypothetical protein